MRLQSIQISNYRSFDSSENKLEIPDIKEPISIIGHNNSGKTNLIQAILTSTAQIDDWYSQWSHDFHNENTEEKINITTKFSEGFPVLSPYPGEKTDKECFGSSFTCGFVNGRGDAYLRCIDQNDKIIIKQEKMKAQGLPANFSTYKKNLSIVYINFHDLDKHLSLGNNGLLAQLFRDIKQDFYKPENTIKVSGGTEKSRSQVFEILTEKLKKVLSTDMLKEFVDQLGEEVTTSLEIEGDAVDFNFTFASAREIYNRAGLMVSDAKGKFALPVSRLGSGLKAMIIIAMLKVLADRNDKEKIFILEEPETFLHELYQDYLYSVLCKLAENNQVIYTTHSKKFVDIFEPKSIVKIHNPDFQKSTIIQVTKNMDVPQEVLDELSLSNVDDFSYFMRSLDPNLGLILFARKALIVEGPHDVIAYRLIFKDVSLSSKNIAIVAAWGKDTSIYIAKLLKFFVVDHFLIHDWDLDDNNIDIALDKSDAHSIYSSLSAVDKVQYSKNHKILKECGENLHWNKKNLESVLGIVNKGTKEIAEKLSGKSMSEICSLYPDFVSKALIDFMEAGAAN